MTKQEYYDLLVRSAGDGTFPGWSVEIDSCAYFGEGKRRCAVGVLIPEHLRDATLKINGEAVWRLVAELEPHGFDLCGEAGGLSVGELGFIQNAHDIATRDDGARFDRDHFIHTINHLACFADVAKVQP